MSFNTGLSGIRAANTDLSVTGNNIANAGTVGFKGSRAEFGDVYTSSILGGGSNTAGSGVTSLMLRQGFSQGNLKFTQNALDLAVNGSGFFVVNDGGNKLYTRAGAFGLDKEGNVVSSTGALLQGFGADASGRVSGVMGNLKVDVSTQAPRQTTGVEAAVNVDANQKVLETVGKTFQTNGTGIGEAELGSKVASTESLSLDTPIVIPPTLSFSPANRTTFTLSRTDPASGAVVSNTISLTSGNATSLATLANLINSANFDQPVKVNVEAYADEATNTLHFRDLATGANSTIDVTLDAANSDANPLTAALAAGQTVTNGVPQVSNNYGSHTLVIQGPTGTPLTYVSKYGAGADITASELNSLAGVSATATTNATLYKTDAVAGTVFTNNGSFQINGVTLASSGAPDMTGLRDEINRLTKSTLFGISAEIDVNGNLSVTSSTGRDLSFGFGAAGGTAQIQGPQGNPQIVNDAVSAVKVGGEIKITLDAGYTITNSQPTVPVSGGSLFGSINVPSFFTDVPINSFDPKVQATYNHSTSAPIYDSLGNEHRMTTYFVKQDYNVSDPTTTPNHWKMYVQIDGQDVGDPDPTLPSPQNTQPTMASFDVHFNKDGTLNLAQTSNLLISNWTPMGADGKIIGALNPLNVLQGGTLPVAEPPSSSNFVIDLTGSTQFGSAFSVENLVQDGYTTGRLSGLDVDKTGILFARFTNGEAQTLGQVALANFNNTEGLKPMGNTMWAQTFETGEAIIGAPGTASLGDITSGALEESNVDLSEELVNLIVAQRNYQANAKTIETANATTQTIINLR
jgi:flagellar hook protein FlgE